MTEFKRNEASGSRAYEVTCGDSGSAKFKSDDALEVLLSSNELSGRAIHGWLWLHQERTLGYERSVTIFALTLQCPGKYVHRQSILEIKWCSPIKDQKVPDELPPGPNHLSLIHIGRRRRRR